jgi:acetate kinase
MDTILVVNAGSSSVKFQVFAAQSPGDLARRIKGQIDGIGTRPRLRGTGADGAQTVDREFRREDIADVPTALHTAAAWLRGEQQIHPTAVGQCVVHGGSDFDRPAVVTAEVPRV